jgi:hypothetical protein
MNAYVKRLELVPGVRKVPAPGQTSKCVTKPEANCHKTRGKLSQNQGQTVTKPGANYQTPETNCHKTWAQNPGAN